MGGGSKGPHTLAPWALDIDLCFLPRVLAELGLRIYVIGLRPMDTECRLKL